MRTRLRCRNRLGQLGARFFTAYCRAVDITTAPILRLKGRRAGSGILALLGIMGLAYLPTGCAPVHPSTSMGTGTYSYATGALTWIYPVTIERLWPATLAEVEDLQLHVLNKYMDGLGAEIKAVRGDKVEVHFTLKPVGTQSTSLSVRILGQEWKRAEAEHIHAKIRQRLGLTL